MMMMMMMMMIMPFPTASSEGGDAKIVLKMPSVSVEQMMNNMAENVIRFGLFLSFDCWLLN